MAVGELNDRQRRFVDEYAVDANATQAAIRAGYSPKTAEQQGSRLLRNAQVRAAVDERLDEASERAEHTREELEQRLWAIVLGSLRDVLEWGPEGARLRPSSELSEEQAATVRELKLESLQVGDDEMLRLVKSQVKQHDPIRAARLLAKMRGWLVERVEHSGSVGLTLERLHELAREREPDEEG